MSDHSKKTIEVVTFEDPDLSRGPVDLVSKHIDVEQLRNRFRDFMANLQSIVDLETQEVGPFQLNEIEFSAEISANGDFKLMGAGIGIGGNSAIKFVLKRQVKL